MIITPIKTRIIMPPRDDLLSALKKALPRVRENTVLVITSKVVSIWQGRCIPKAEISDKDELIKQEADFYLSREATPHGWVMHTLKHNIFIPSAGIDESNANEHYILWPQNPAATAKVLWQWARKTYRLRNVGIIISDSRSLPLRRGVVGFALSYYGFHPLKEYRGTPDLFGRKLKMTLTDFPDALASGAVAIMGEGKESTPAAVIADVPMLKFTGRPYRARRPHSSYDIKTKEDIYYPLLSSVLWKKGGGGRRSHFRSWK
ncbi:MAG: coenzyme F420-0:L-glutamate ligase [Candidatus Sungbacteria bacterium]|uniref:Coenzyme F420-0:L-glutamate ligase n=1 Tax=Candidatus Sungiibacteriota bacterium TaxID=2750080 RepID=A0A932VS54_9BACT|nr:coenzyme F420-0:L-glutamate ligase [Candidatus Sungbacteria bacterium]